MDQTEVKPDQLTGAQATPFALRLEGVLLKKKRCYRFFKRSFDIVCSLAAILVLFVPALIISLIIVIDSPGASPIYVQKRVGKNGKIFKFYKFRTMVANADRMLDTLLSRNEMDGPVFKIKNDPRITRVGRFLRCTSIDELPQLINIVRGEMSFVGPRPPIPREVEMYTDYQRLRLCVTPGLTCFWQVQHMRNTIPFDEWVELDLKYIRERSFWLDLKLIFLTVGAVMHLEGE